MLDLLQHGFDLVEGVVGCHLQRGLKVKIHRHLNARHDLLGGRLHDQSERLIGYKCHNDFELNFLQQKHSYSNNDLVNAASWLLSLLLLLLLRLLERGFKPKRILKQTNSKTIFKP